MPKPGRKNLTKKTRFEVFKRDGFTCCYCGATPPSVVLEVDHIDPVANGGSNDKNNLITACFGCNRGKGKTLLSSVSRPLSDHYDDIKEREEQLRGYNRLITSVKRREKTEENKIGVLYSSFFQDYQLTDHFKRIDLRGFIDKLGFPVVEEAMELACLKIDYSKNGALKYFCGICWRKIKGDSRWGSR